MDFFIATETWINSTPEETVCIEYSALSIDGFRISICNQSNGLKGGGIALIKLLDKVMMNTFEYRLWSISTDSNDKFLGLYITSTSLRKISLHHQTIYHRI